MTSHTSNVLVTLSDRKFPVQSGGTGTVYDFYEPNVLSYSDYYPFGSLLPGRNASSASYRYGFIGKENDNEVNNVTGGSQDHNFRSYDPRLGRYKSLDPLASEYPWNSPFVYAENRVIDGIDLEGREFAHAASMDKIIAQTEAMVGILQASGIETKSLEQAIAVMKFSNTAVKVIGVTGVALGAAYYAAPVVVNYYLTNPNAIPQTQSFILGLGGYDGISPTGASVTAARGIYKILSKSGKTKEQMAKIGRQFYKKLTSNIPDMVRSKGVSLKKQAKMAFNMRNRAKVLAREVSGPANKAEAEKYSANMHGGKKLGPSFKDLFNKHYKAAMDGGADKEGATKAAYNAIIDSSPKTNKAVDKATGL